MSTPDPNAHALADESSPGELRLASTQLPDMTETPSLPFAAASSTPGVSGAALRHPGAPTLPDFDPISLGNAISLLANDLFASSPNAGNAAPTPSLADPARSPAVSPPSAPIPAPATPSAFPIASDYPIAPERAPAPAVPPALTPAPAPAPATPAATAPATGPATRTRATPASTPPPLSPFDVDLDLDAIAAAAFAPAAHEPFGAPALPLLVAFTEPLRSEPGAAPEPAVTAPRADAWPSFEISPTSDPSIPSSSTDERARRGAALDPHAIRSQFPILQQRIHGRRLVWLDNAATTQKPQAVIDRLATFYERENSNVHRAAHTLAARATDAYESARDRVRRFLNAPSSREIVFVRGATEGINLVAQSWGRRNVEKGDEIVITWLEHHANIVPWQQLCSERGARLRVAPVDDRGQVILEEYEKLFNQRTRLVAFAQVSNALGTITPAKQMVEIARRYGAIVLVDGAQAVSHMRVDVQALDCDFYVFSGHKVFAPTGIGALFGRRELLDTMPPWQGGGNMIEDVTFERTRFQPAPSRFEAGTGNIADAVGLGAALDWLSGVGIDQVERYELELLVYATERLATVPGLTMIGTAPDKAGVLSFVLSGQKTEEIGGMLDAEGIAVRSGHHCAQPILRRFGREATVRASLAPYNTPEDIDALVAALQRIQAGRPSS